MEKKLHRATIERLSHDGKGIAKISGKTTFISNSLPGEEVNFEYTKRQSSFDAGEAIEILKRSPDRVDHKCKHYSECGGCSLQHLEHKKQIKFKTQVLLEQLHHIAGLKTAVVSKIVTGPTYGYRSKARLSAKYVKKKEKLLVGFHERRGRFVVETESCPVLSPEIGEKIEQLAKLIGTLSIYQQIPQLEVACADEINSIVIRHLQDFSKADISAIEKFSIKNSIYFYSQRGGIKTVKPINHNKTLSYHIDEGDITIEFAPTDFTQINREINKELVSHTLELLDPKPDETILDLFCGIGNFTLPIAKKSLKVTGIEGSGTAIERAIANSEKNGINNADFFCFDLTKDLTAQPWFKQQPDKILLDPPRSGALEICQEISKLAPKKIVYVSCNPATMARDVKIITDAGYKLEDLLLFDMYPHTSHMESVASFVLTS